MRRDGGAVWVGVSSVVCEEGRGSSVGGSGECGVWGGMGECSLVFPACPSTGCACSCSRTSW